MSRMLGGWAVGASAAFVAAPVDSRSSVAITHGKNRRVVMRRDRLPGIVGIVNDWRIVMVRHARPAKAKDSYHARALIDPGRKMVIEVAFDDAEIIEPW